MNVRNSPRVFGKGTTACTLSSYNDGTLGMKNIFQFAVLHTWMKKGMITHNARSVMLVCEREERRQERHYLLSRCDSVKGESEKTEGTLWQSDSFIQIGHVRINARTLRGLNGNEEEKKSNVPYGKKKWERTKANLVLHKRFRSCAVCSHLTR